MSSTQPDWLGRPRSVVARRRFTLSPSMDSLSISIYLGSSPQPMYTSLLSGEATPPNTNHTKKKKRHRKPGTSREKTAEHGAFVSSTKRCEVRFVPVHQAINPPLASSTSTCRRHRREKIFLLLFLRPLSRCL